MAGGMAVASVGDALAAATDALRAAGVETPRLDAELLLAEATGLSRSALVVESARGVSGAEARAFGAMVRRRVAREPVAYVLGRKGFRRIELRVDGRALIPRPETELLVEVALRERPRSVLDVGTGSGAIALAIADELPEAEVVAVDTSAAALELARANAARVEGGGRVRFELGELPAACRPRGFDLIVANLPYVEEGELTTLAPEIVRYEPEAALFAGPDGLDAIRALIARIEPTRRAAGKAEPTRRAAGRVEPTRRAVEEAPPATAAAMDSDRAGPNRRAIDEGPDGGPCKMDSDRADPNRRAGAEGGRAEMSVDAESGPVRCAAVALEVGAGQDERVAALLAEAGFVSVQALPDLAGIPRVVVGRAGAKGSV